MISLCYWSETFAVSILNEVCFVIICSNNSASETYSCKTANSVLIWSSFLLLLLQQARSWCRKSAKQNKHPYPSVSTDSHFTTLPGFHPQSHQSVPEPPKEMSQNKVHHANGLGHYLGFSQQDLRHSDQEDFTRRSSSASSMLWSFQRSKSLFCLPTVSSSSASETAHFSEAFQFLNTESPATRLKTWRCSPRLNIDDLEDAQETDVDTGRKLSFSDLSVVSAYSGLNRFCNDLEASLPLRKQACRMSTKASISGRLVSSVCSTFDPMDGSLPSLSEWSSSSFMATSLSKQPKQSSRTAPCSLDDCGSIFPVSPTNDEEFYIWGFSVSHLPGQIFFCDDWALLELTGFFSWKRRWCRGVH